MSEGRPSLAGPLLNSTPQFGPRMKSGVPDCVRIEANLADQRRELGLIARFGSSACERLSVLDRDQLHMERVHQFPALSAKLVRVGRPSQNIDESSGRVAE